jgi:5-methylthioadenosine/S-adenosylhomocysteine deaminase
MSQKVDLLIRDGAILPLDDEEASDWSDTLITDGILAVNQGEIVDIGPSNEVGDRYEGRETIDASGKLLMPGLIDTHHHFLQNFLKGSRDDLQLSEWIEEVSSPVINMAVQDYLKGETEIQTQATRLGCLEALKSGITTILNMEWATDPELVSEYERFGIRVDHTLTFTDLDEWDNPEMLLPLEQGFELAEGWMNRCDKLEHDRINFRYGLADPISCSENLIGEIRDRAEEEEVGIHTHVAETEYEATEIKKKHGLTPVEYLQELDLLGSNVLGAHVVWVEDKDIQILADSETSVAHNPECNMKLADGVAPVKDMLDAGIPVSIGTDTTAANDNMDIFEAMRIAGMLQKVTQNDPSVLPAYEALKMGTLGGAQALGRDQSIGSLARGKRADVILVELGGIHMQPINNLINNLVYSASAVNDVETVIVDGEIIVRENEFVSIDEEKVLKQSKDFARNRFSEEGIELPRYY